MLTLSASTGVVLSVEPFISVPIVVVVSLPVLVQLVLPITVSCASVTRFLLVELASHAVVVWSQVLLHESVVIPSFVLIVASVSSPVFVQEVHERRVSIAVV